MGIIAHVTELTKQTNRKEQPRTMIITKTNLNRASTTARSRSDRFGQTLPFVGTSHRYPAAPFDGGIVF